ncbi:MAG: zinc ribbon domain-containing protein [Terracidiphilus sp.]
MAVYCGKCGAEVPSDKQFCANCGTPLAAAAVPPAYAPPTYAPVPTSVPPPGYPQQSYPGAVAPPPAKSGGALKIILIVVAVVVGLGILGVGAVGFTVWRVAHAIHASGSGSDFSVDTPGGKITANSTEHYSASDLGTDIYPGAQPGKGSMRMSLPTGSVITAIYTTTDSKDQVVSFYKSRLGGESSVYDNANSAVLSLQKGQKETIMVTVSQNEAQDEGKTKIAIMHTKSTRE